MGTIWHEDGRSAPLPLDDLRRVAIGMLDARRAMRGSLPAAFIQNVALEMLLALHIAHPGAVDPDELVSDQVVPPSSACRWLVAIVAEELAVVGSDGVRLTDGGLAAMTDTLSRVVASQRRLLGWADN